MHRADGKNFMLFDLGENYTCWSAGVVTADAAASKRADAAKDRVLAAYAGWADLVEGIVTATPAADIVERPISDRPPLKRWSEGRVTLMGDAAHPVVPALGQGANMAFEDAYELAGFLAAGPDVTAAFEAYERAASRARTRSTPAARAKAFPPTSPTATPRSPKRSPASATTNFRSGSMATGRRLSFLIVTRPRAGAFRRDFGSGPRM